MIPFLSESNTGGIKTLQICRHDLVDWANFPPRVNSNIATAIPLLAGGYWERLQFPPKFTEYTEEPQEHRGFLGHTEIIIPKSRPYIIEWFENREAFRYIMLVQDWNDDIYLVGTEEHPVKLTMKLRKSGNQPTALNASIVEFNCKLARRSPFYLYTGSTVFVDFLAGDFFASDFFA